MKTIFLYISIAIIFLGATSIVDSKSALAEAVNSGVVIQKVAITPFVVNGKQEQGYLQKGILHMLDSRLSWPGHIKVVSLSDAKQVLKDFHGKTEFAKAKGIAAKTDSRFVVTGSVTCLGDSFSLDVKLFDIHEKRYRAFFEHSDNSEILIDKVDRICATINKHAFSRNTVTWDTMLQEQRVSVNELNRRNPEYLMENPAWQSNKEPSGWKFWKNWF